MSDMQETWSDSHWTAGPYYREQMDTKTLKSLIAHWGDNILRNGAICYIQTKHIAAGMYNVWFEARPSAHEVGDEGATK